MGFVLSRQGNRMKEMLTVRAVSKICLTARVLFRFLDSQAEEDAGATVEEGSSESM